MSMISGTITNGIELGGGGYASPLTITSTGYVNNNTSAFPSMLESTVYLAVNGATLVNQGRIAANGGYVGVFGQVGDAATINNQGAIYGFYGVYLNHAGQITNSGTITGIDGILFDSSAGSSTVVDSGTIVGGTLANQDAIRFGDANDLLQFSPSASAKIDGVVDGGGGTNTLEFASGTGTLTGVGADFLNFGNGMIDSGAHWTFAGTNTIGSTTTLTNSGSFVDTGTLTNFGTITGALPNTQSVMTLAAGAYVSNLAGGVIAAGTLSEIVGYVVSGARTINNAGSIGNTDTAGYAVFLQGTIADHLINSGTITTDAGAVYLSHGTVTNSGKIAGAAANYAAGIGYGYLDNSGTGSINGVFVLSGTVVNDGTITNSDIFAIRMLNTGTVIDSGKISGDGSTAVHFGNNNNLLKLFPGATITNGKVVTGGTSNVLELASAAGSGTISNALNTQYQDFGTIKVDAGANWTLTGTSTLASGVTLTDYGTLTNNGTLTGSGALVVDPATMVNTGSVGIGVTLDAGSYLDNTSTGTINGGTRAVYGKGGAVSVNNAGTIYGSSIGIVLGAGGSIANSGTAALISGYAAAIKVQNAAGTLSNAGMMEATGASGIGVYLSGGGSVANTGTIAATGGSHGVGVELVLHGGNVANIGTAAVIEGGAYGVAVFMVAGTVSNAGTISGGTDAVKFFGNDTDRVIVDPGAKFVGNVVGGSGSNTLELASAASQGTISNALNAQYLGFQTITVDSGAQWKLTGTSTLASGVTLTDAGTLANAGTLTVDPPIYVSGSFDNTGSVNAPGTYSAFSITSGGVLSNAASGVITSGDDAVRASGTVHVSNYGTITASGMTADAVHLTAGGTIVNGSTADTSALLEGYAGVFAQNSAAHITNFGTILANPTLDGVGVNLDTAGTLINGAAGSTAALIEGGRFGVNDNASKATITNFGTITGTDLGIYLVGGGTVIDAGKIVGGGPDAIAFGVGSTGGNLLVLERGFSISGAVSSVASANNSVELLGTSSASAVTATYNNLSLTNFGTIAFGPSVDNYATLRITNNATLPHTIAGFTGLHDVVDLTQLSDAGNDAFAMLDTATNVLTVTGDNGSVQLQLDAENYTGVGWAVTSDGSGGSDIIVASSPPDVTVALLDDTGASSSDKITNDPRLSGGGAPDATVIITQGTATLGTTTANGSGVWVFDPTGLADGTQTLTARETTSDGTGIASLTFDLDTTAPSVAITSGGSLTGQPVQTISGTVSDPDNLPANPLITLFDNGNEIGTATASGGVWSASVTLPQQGANAITAQATDLAGNTGTSAADTLTLDTTPPSAMKDSPLLLPAEDTATIPESLLAFADNLSSDAQETYTVIAAPQAGTLLLDGSPISSFTQAEIDAGEVSYQETAPGASSDSFGFTVSDAAGNVTAPQQFQFAIASTLEGGQFGFFLPPNQTLSVVFTPDGSNLPAAISGDFNLEVITAPTQSSYPLPQGYQGVAIFPGGTGKALTLLAGDINVSDSGPADSIVGGTGFSTIGGGQLDTIVGGSNNEFIDGTQGYESITGGSAGDETIFGGSGDTIAAGGATAVIGGARFDTLTGGTGTDFLDGTQGNQVITGGSAGTETIWGGAGDTIDGGSGANVTIGGVAGDTIAGGAGSVFVDGTRGDQLITVGSAGSETIWGGNGDTVFGGAAQGLIGFSTVPGAGAEFFSDNSTTAATAIDTVAGFSQADGDRVLLNGASATPVIASAQTAAGNTTITFADGSQLTLLGITSVNNTFFA